MDFRKLQIADMDLLQTWLHQDHVREYFGDPGIWLSEITENMYSDWIFYFIVYMDQVPFGFVQYYETCKAPEGIWSFEPEGTAGIDYMIGDVNYLRKNYGTQIVNKLVDYIRKQQKFQYIIADPIIENNASVLVLVKNGFVKQNSGLYRLVL
jgi:RimJ/RimL family protein N-acetyltransferase